MMVGKTLVASATASLLLAGPAFAGSEVEEELAEMRQLVQELKDRVEAQEEQIEHQGGMLEDAQRVVRQTQEAEDGTLSSVSEFWGAIDVNMSAAASYAYNFRNPDLGAVGPGIGANTGGSGLFYPFHPDHNSFQVDQVWLDVGKSPTEESRGGFMFSILYGNTAAFLGQGGNTGVVPVVVGTPVPGGGTDLDGDGIADVILSSDTGTGVGITGLTSTSRRALFDSSSDYYVHQAYVSWLAPVPVGEGVEVIAGKFGTIIGMEVADASKNWNITRGNVYNLLQPIDHIGVLGVTDVGPLTIKAGVVNEISLLFSSPDINKEKSYLASVGVGTDMLGLTVNMAYGADGTPVTGLRTNEGRDLGLVDVVATLNTDGFEAWVNADYAWVEETSLAGWGVAVAGRVPITDVFSAALRLEYARDKSNFFGLAPANPAPFGSARHSEVYGATGTLAYELAENLTLKGEVRYDRVVYQDFGGPEEFFSNTAKGDNDQVVGLGQLIYAF